MAIDPIRWRLKEGEGHINHINVTSSREQQLMPLANQQRMRFDDNQSKLVSWYK